jgi:hypothetical protein
MSAGAAFGFAAGAGFGAGGVAGLGLGVVETASTAFAAGGGVAAFASGFACGGGEGVVPACESGVGVGVGVSVSPGCVAVEFLGDISNGRDALSLDCDTIAGAGRGVLPGMWAPSSATTALVGAAVRPFGSSRVGLSIGGGTTTGSGRAGAGVTGDGAGEAAAGVGIAGGSTGAFAFGSRFGPTCVSRENANLGFAGGATLSVVAVNVNGAGDSTRYRSREIAAHRSRSDFRSRGVEAI